MDREDLEQRISGYRRHLCDLAVVFNDWAARKGFPVRMKPDKAIAAVESGVGLARVATLWSGADDTGVVHESQLKTAIDCMWNLFQQQQRCGHVVGAMQSGKTTTSLALQWVGVVLYLLTDQRPYPFYIIGNQTNHEDQTKTELERFLAYYGDVAFELAPGTPIELTSRDAMFLRSPTLATYREHVVRKLKQDLLTVPQLEDVVHRRVGGAQGLKKIVELCGCATREGYRPLMIIDEPQFGASDRVVEGDNGPESRKCVLTQIFDSVEAELGSTRNDHWFVGLSATPFELNDLERIWEVRQSLTDAYSGFNFFNGEAISPGVNVVPPRTLGQSDFAQEIGVPFLAHVSLPAYDRASALARHAKRIDYDENDHDGYRADVEQALRNSIYALLGKYAEEDDAVVGLCIRAFNDNTKTRALIQSLDLDRDRVEVLEYYGGGSTGLSVKRAIAQRARPHLPYVVFVTNRARMADAFPKEVRFFMDFAQKASDLNALLQGLLGRACGYSKKSTVVLSDINAEIVRQYVATSGGYVHKTSRHSIALGGFRRGAPTGMLKLRVELDDPRVQEFFRRVDAEVVIANIPAGSVEPRIPRKRGGAYRTAPLLLIAESLDLFDHLERPEVRARLFPQFPMGFRVARRNDEVRHAHKAQTLRYATDPAGNCRYTFRWSERTAAAEGGAQGRAMGKKDVGQHMEPTIYIEKFDPVTGETLPLDRDLPDAEKKAGSWRAFMVTFPLREPVREVRAAEIAYPIKASTYNSWMAPGEQSARDRAEAGAKARPAASP